MTNYGFDVKKMVAILLPSFLRKSRLIAWLVALLAPFDRLRSEFMIFITQTRYEAGLTGQVTVLQMALNNSFDFAQRRIEILDGNLIGTYIWFGSENQVPDYTKFKNETDDYSPYLRFKTENVESSDFDFIVRVPIEYQSSEVIIKSVINSYKLAGKRFNIIYI